MYKWSNNLAGDDDMERLGSPEHALQDFEGTYIGVSPTDESACGMGEIELTIDAEKIRVRWATGLQIQEDEIPLTEARELTSEEVDDWLVEGAERPGGLRMFDVAGLQYVFFDTQRDPDAAQLLVRGSMGDILGPTALFNPEQVARGLHERAFRELEAEFGEPGDIPRLSNDGHALRYR